MAIQDLLSRLDQYVGDAAPEERPALIVALASRISTLASVMLADSQRPKPTVDPTAEPERLMTVTQAAELLTLPTSRVYDLVRRKDLASVRIGKYIRIRHGALAQFIERNEHGGSMRRPPR